MSLFEIGGLTKSFGGLEAVRNLHFVVTEGEILGMIGPNGAGKTTVFNLITGFLRPSLGSILFKGEDLVGQRPHQICKKGITRTFQVVQPLEKLTALENVMVGAFSRLNSTRAARDEAIQCLEFVGLLQKRDLMAGSLTIADRKALELARAVATKPELLLLDEVVAGLNPRETDRVIALIRELRDSGITLIVVEHVMKAIMSLSDRIIVLSQGEKIAEGTPEEIAHNEEVIGAYLGRDYLA